MTNVLLMGVSLATTGSWQLRIRRVLQCHTVGIGNGLAIAAYLREALDMFYDVVS